MVCKKKGEGGEGKMLVATRLWNDLQKECQPVLVVVIIVLVPSPHHHHQSAHS